MSFNKDKIHELFPEAEELMWEPQLCWKLPKGKEYMFEEVCGSGDYFASLKKDGACYQVVRTNNHCYLFGRTISRTTGLLTEKIDNVPQIKKAFSILPPKTVVVVEIYYPGKTSKDVTSVMGCLPQLAIKRQEERGPIHAYAHDILMYDGVDLRNTSALERYKILEAIWNLHNLSAFDFLELAQPIYENIFEAASKALRDGEEGLVLRKKTAGWSCGKRPAWATIKLKQTDSIDLVCIGLCEATKEYTGKDIETWSYWSKELPVSEECLNVSSAEALSDKCMFGIEGWIPVTKPYFLGWKTAMKIGAYDDNENLVELGTVSSGLTDEIRMSMTNEPKNFIGKVIALDCMSIDYTEHTLRHPVFKCMREDKNSKECLISEVFK